MRYLTTRVHTFMPPADSSAAVKIAIIDTGVTSDGALAHLFKQQMRGLRVWNEQSLDANGKPGTLKDDHDGHGTHLVSTLLRVNPFCKVYVAKVFEKRNQKQGPAMAEAIQQRVANAINYCIHKWKVDIISLSFGFDEHVPAIDQALRAAEDHRIVVLAAASNNGGNDGISWPARHPTVLGVYATDGYGNKYPRNPSPQVGEDNFATLGMEVEAWGLGAARVNRSGTSVATPIAAGIVGLVLAFLRRAKSGYVDVAEGISGDVYDERVERLTSFAAVRKVLRLMVEERDGYSYLEPWKLLSKDAGGARGIVERLLSTIQKA